MADVDLGHASNKIVHLAVRIDASQTLAVTATLTTGEPGPLTGAVLETYDPGVLDDVPVARDASAD